MRGDGGAGAKTLNLRVLALLLSGNLAIVITFLGVPRVERMCFPLHNSSSRRTRQTHTSRKRNLNDTSLTASPASPPQPGTASRAAKKSKKADSAPPSFRIVSPAPVAAKTVSNLITVQSNSDSDSSATMSQGKQTVVPSVSGSQPSAVRIESQAALGTTPYTRMAPTEFTKNKLQWHSLLLELAKHSKETQGPIKDILNGQRSILRPGKFPSPSTSCSGKG